MALTRAELCGIRDASARMLSVLELESIESWASGLIEGLAPLFGADRMFIGAPYSGRIQLTESDSEMLDAAADYLAYYHRLDVHMGVRRRRLGVSAFVHDMLADPSEYRTSEYLIDWVSRHRLLDPAGIAIDVPSYAIPATLALYHDTQRDGRFRPDGLLMLQLLEPAFRSAVELLARNELRGTAFLRAVDQLSVPTLIFDRHAECVHMNKAFARSFLDRRLADRLTERSTLLASALASALRPTRSRTASDLGSPTAELAVSDGRNLTLQAFSIHGMEAGALHVAVQIVGAGEAWTLASPTEVARRSGLTQRQSEVALLLARRLSNNEIARTLSISPHTARRHTEQVLARLEMESRHGVRAAMEAMFEAAADK